jgi:hypothetical protein
LQAAEKYAPDASTKRPPDEGAVSVNGRARDTFVRQNGVSKFKEMSEILHFCGGDFSLFL